MDTKTTPTKVKNITELLTGWDTVEVHVSDDEKFYSIEAKSGAGLNLRTLTVWVSYHMSNRGRIQKARYWSLLNDAKEFTSINDVRTWAHIGAL